MSDFGRLRDYVVSSLALGLSPADKARIFWQQTKNIRVRLNLEKHHPEQVYNLQTIYGSLYFRDNFGDVTNLLNLFYYRTYRIEKITAPGVILDVGANIGLAAAWFAYHNPGRPIYCFEPLPGNARMIKKNCPSAHIEQAAVGAKPSTVRLQVDPYSVMASSVSRALETHQEEFPVITLDEFVQAKGLSYVALLKLDTEGMELDILAGASETLRRTRQVAMETHGYDRHTATIDLLHQSGFELDAAEFDGETGMIFASRK